MSLCVIDKYVTKKERDLLEYSKILESLISLEVNNMWHNKKEFAVYVKDIIKIYAENYYFDNFVHRDNPIDYSNDNISSVLHSIIDYFKQNNCMPKIKEWKNETFLLSVIICTACYVDFATNVVDGDISDTKNKFKYLLKYYSKTKILRISNNKYWINDLFTAIKKNALNDQKVLDSFTNESISNTYYEYIKDSKYYSYQFDYKIPGLENKDEALIEKVTKEYESKLLEISYELLIVQLLKDYISNSEMKYYLVEANPLLNKKNNLLKMFDNKYILDYVRFIMPYEDTIINEKILSTYRDNIIFIYSKTNPIQANVLRSDTKYIVSQEFLDNNQDNELSWKNKNIEFIVMEMEEK